MSFSRSKKVKEGRRDYCVYTKCYLNVKDSDSALRALAPMLLKTTEERGYSRFFFIRYTDREGFHFRLRFFGKPKSVQARARDLLVAEMTATLDRAGIVSRFVIGKYRPEFGRYGGKFGTRLQEQISWLDSRVILQFLALAEPLQKLEKVEFGIAMGEFLLHRCGVSLKIRDQLFRSYAIQRRPEVGGGVEIQTVLNATRILAPRVSEVRRNPKILLRLSNPSMRSALREFDINMKRMKSALLLLQSLETEKRFRVVSSYLHLHLNRLGYFGADEQKVCMVRNFVAEIAR